jgi:hypothetical protein
MLCRISNDDNYCDRGHSQSSLAILAIFAFGWSQRVVTQTILYLFDSLIQMLLKGEVSADRQEELDTLAGKYEKLLGSAAALSDLLDRDLPDLPEETETESAEGRLTNGIDISNPFKDIEDRGGDSGLWEDNEAREFYESITDRRAHVPAMLFHVKADESKPEEDGECFPAATVNLLRTAATHLHPLAQ